MVADDLTSPENLREQRRRHVEWMFLRAQPLLDRLRGAGVKSLSASYYYGDDGGRMDLHRVEPESSLTSYEASVLQDVLRRAIPCRRPGDGGVGGEISICLRTEKIAVYQVNDRGTRATVSTDDLLAAMSYTEW